MEEGAKKKESSSHDREVKGYLPPSVFSYFTAYKELNEMGKSEALKVIVRDFFDKMPAEDRKRLLSQSKNSY